MGNSLFFVYEGALDVNLYIDRLHDLASAKIAAAFPTRHEAVAHALTIKDKSTVVVERGITVQSGDENNLISQLEWEVSNEAAEKEPELFPDLTGVIAITGEPVIGQALSVVKSFIDSSLGPDNEYHCQWLRSGFKNVPGVPIPDAVAPSYALTSYDLGMYITVQISRDGYLGTLVSQPPLGPVKDA